MGWITTHYDKRNYPHGVASYFFGTPDPDGLTWRKREWDGTTTIYEVAARALVERREFYAVIRFKTERQTEFGEWFCLVNKIEWNPKSDHNFGYKDMEESVGPTISRAPERLLKVLEEKVPLPVLAPEVEAELAELDRQEEAYFASGPERKFEDYQAICARISELDDHHTARRWRARCWNAVALRAAASRVQPGDKLKFAAPIRFTDGHEADVFTADRTRRGAGLVFRSVLNDRIYRITDWKERVYSFVGEGEAPGAARLAEEAKRLKERADAMRAEGQKVTIARGGYLRVHGSWA